MRKVEWDGPTWAEVEEYCIDLATRYGGQVAVYCIPPCRRPPSPQNWQITCQYHTRGRLDEPPVARSGYSFRGNSGARSMPAALFIALQLLEDALGGRERSSRD